MKTQHSEVFYYAIAVYALGAAANLALPNGTQPDAARTAANQKHLGGEVGPEMTKISVRNAVSSQTSGLVFAGTAEKF